MVVNPAASITASPSASRQKSELAAKAHMAHMVKTAILNRYPFAVVISLAYDPDGKGQQELTQIIQGQTDETIEKLIFEEAVPGDKYIREIKRQSPEENKQAAG